MSSHRTTTALFALASLGAIGTLAGCSTTASADGAAGAGGGSSSASGSSAGSDSSEGGSSGAVSQGTYRDGKYTEHGTYASPGGQETISVALTLRNNFVTAVTVKTVTADPTAREYEELFESGVAKVVVGKNIDSLNVTRVAGSSLTSKGFDDALAKIKADAAK